MYLGWSPLFGTKTCGIFQYRDVGVKGYNIVAFIQQVLGHPLAHISKTDESHCVCIIDLWCSFKEKLFLIMFLLEKVGRISHLKIIGRKFVMAMSTSWTKAYNGKPDCYLAVKLIIMEQRPPIKAGNFKRTTHPIAVQWSWTAVEADSKCWNSINFFLDDFVNLEPHDN